MASSCSGGSGYKMGGSNKTSGNSGAIKAALGKVSTAVRPQGRPMGSRGGRSEMKRMEMG